MSDFDAWRDSLTSDEPPADALDHLAELPETPQQRQIRLRALQDVWSASEATYWERRAETFEAARPRPGDHPGGPVDWDTGKPTNPPPPEATAAVDDRLAASASECRRRAAACQPRERDIT